MGPRGISNAGNSNKAFSTFQRLGNHLYGNQKVMKTMYEINIFIRKPDFLANSKPLLLLEPLGQKPNLVDL